MFYTLKEIVVSTNSVPFSIKPVEANAFTKFRPNGDAIKKKTNQKQNNKQVTEFKLEPAHHPSNKLSLIDPHFRKGPKLNIFHRPVKRHHFEFLSQKK